ncbi:TetR/AcrR family transcriptional regulator [Hymenobacter cellulosivorans]|uniref:TetR family transcriptional regulator C-terminal domain-containing protein n=1 Tax=Hymenobacter cellulosivorans TaxID=2932249 RepID=A0ABY4F3A4_9BACT|nr:TetR family transcriptional regulator C-terminal domain-containing protein [Hymenobacter cellulosivorans]UOQ51013.1 TetR family transcriptional regulator C-terminal domain-containing protein [Hymenobacter cellulosivorans]
MDKDRIKQAYLDYVLRKGTPPASVYKLTSKLNIPEAEFYQYYANFDAIDREIWADFARQARQRAATEPVWEQYGAREKLLGFYYTLLELLKQNRSYALNSLRRSLHRMPGLTPRVLDDFRQDFEQFVQDILQEGKRTEEVAVRPLVQEQYPRLFWQQALFVLGFFAKDDSLNFERTDAAIEKAVTLSFDLVGRNTLDSALDLARFLVNRR